MVDLGEPKLTHVLVDRRDVSRRLELMKRTSQSVIFTPNSYTKLTMRRPKRRYLVVSEYIQACLDEGTLLDEDGECLDVLFRCR